jgi:hypothetical protein
MLERLGNVLFWLGAFVAALFVALAVTFFFAITENSDQILMTSLAGAAAVISFAVGWVLRYILVDRS